MQHSTASSRGPKGLQGSSILTSPNTTPLGPRRKLTSSAAPATPPTRPTSQTPSQRSGRPHSQRSCAAPPPPSTSCSPTTATHTADSAGLRPISTRSAPLAHSCTRGFAPSGRRRALPAETAGDYGARRWAVLEMAEGVRAHCERVLRAISEREAPCLPVDDITGDIFTSTGEVYDAAGRYVGAVAPEEYARKGLFFA